jgi:hypothetical protein
MKGKDDKEAVMFDASRFLPNPHNPFRPPDLRRLRCEYLVEQQQEPTPLDDPMTCAAYPFFRALRKYRTDADHRPLERPPALPVQGCRSKAILRDNKGLQER